MQPVTERAEQFADALRAQLREARRRRGLTQAELAARTGGLVSQAAVANYETGHRSLRMTVFWTLAHALQVDSAELRRGAVHRCATPPHDSNVVSVRVADVLATTNPELAPVRRWISIQHPGEVIDGLTERIDGGALAALARLMGMTVEECRDCLLNLGRHSRHARHHNGRYRKSRP